MGWRARTWTVLDGHHPRYGRAYAIFTNLTVAVAVAAYAASTLPDLSPGTERALIWLERVIILIFAGDYLARLICAPHPVRYAFSFWGIVDLLAWAPALFLASTEMTSARMLRLIQLARILKLVHLAQAFDRMLFALRDIREQLLVFLILTLIVLFLSAVGIYQFEHAAQPDVFKSVPHALWWSVATLSTVGYGDIYPVTAGGRFFTGIVLLIGLAVIAVPTGLISAALVSQSKTNRKDEDDDDETS